MFYFIALILGMWFLRDRSRGTLTFFGALVGMLVFTIGFGAIIEVLQHNYTVNREGDFYDALANSLGACCAAIWVNYGVSMKNALTWKR